MTCDMLMKLNWDPLAVKRKKQKAIMMFKIVHGMAPPYLTDHFNKKVVGNSYKLRGSRFDVKLPKVRTDFLKDSFVFTGA